MLEQCSNHLKQWRHNVAILCYASALIIVPWRNLTIFFLDQCLLTQTNIFSFCLSLSPICRIHFVFFSYLNLVIPTSKTSQIIESCQPRSVCRGPHTEEAVRTPRSQGSLLLVQQFAQRFLLLGIRVQTFPLENLLLVHFEKQVNTTAAQSLGTNPTILTWEPQSIINGRILVLNKELKVGWIQLFEGRLALTQG